MIKKGVLCGDVDIEGPVGSAVAVVHTSGRKPAVPDGAGEGQELPEAGTYVAATVTGVGVQEDLSLFVAGLPLSWRISVDNESVDKPCGGDCEGRSIDSDTLWGGSKRPWVTAAAGVNILCLVGEVSGSKDSGSFCVGEG